MKNLITYLKALWSWVSGSQRKKIGVTLGEATIEHPFSTYSAPFGTCWQPSGKLHSVVRCAAMLVMLFTLGVGNAWGANIVIDLDLSDEDTYPNDFPTATGTTSGSHTLGGYTFSFSCNTGYYKGSQNAYLMIGACNTTESTASIITFPAIENYKLTEVALTTTSGGATALSLWVGTGFSSPLSGGGAWTYVRSTTKTWTLSGTSANTAYKLYVKRSGSSGTKYCQIANLTLTYEPTGSTKTLSSIAITTQPTTRKYVVGETFSSTGAVVTATYSDASTKSVTATWTPNTALSAGTGQTITASYTEGGVTKTATTTVDVYAVTMQALDEDGNAIGAGGPDAPSRTGASITPAADAGNYVFKEWQITNASLGSSADTKSNTITSPTGAVTVTAVYYKPITITYKANGTTFTTQTYAYGGTLAFPASDPDGATYSCTGKTFMGWVGEANKNYSHASTAPTYATAGGSVTASATYYAVFATASGGGGGASVGTTIFSENFGGYSSGNVPNGSVSSSTGYRVVYNSGSVTYTSVNGGSDTKIYNEYLAGGTSPELLVGKSTGSFSISGIPNGGASELTVSYKQNAKSMTVSVSGTGYSGSLTASTKATQSFTVTVGSASTFTLTFTPGSDNVRLDDISITVKTGGTTYSNYETNCCTPLGTINGSISSINHNSATLEWDKLSNVDGSTPYTVEVSPSAGASVGSIDLSGSKATCTITGLTCETEYTFTITANGASGYCDKSEELVESTTECLCSNYSFHYGPTSGDWSFRCFSQVGSSTEWQIEDFTIGSASAMNQFYVGYQNEFKNSGLGTSGAKSKTVTLQDQLFFAEVVSCDNRATVRSASNSAEGAVGTLRIYSDSNWDNLQCAFLPNGYGLMYGGSGASGNVLPFSNISTGVWETDVVALTADMQKTDNTYKYQVGLATATEGTYVACGNSAASNFGDMGSYYNSGWNGNISTYTEGTAGKFQIWSNSCNNGNSIANWVCHFVPYYTINYYDLDDELIGTDYVVYGTANTTLRTVSGYGWTTNSAADRSIAGSVTNAFGSSLSLSTSQPAGTYNFYLVAPGYTVTFSVPACVTTPSPITSNSVTLPAEPATTPDGYTFAGWTTGAIDSQTTQPTLYSAGSTYNPTSATTLYACYYSTDGSGSSVSFDTYISSVEAGYYVIVFGQSGEQWACGNELLRDKLINPIEISGTNTRVSMTSSTAAAVYQFIADGDYWLLKNMNTGKYLAAVDGSSNTTAFISSATDYARWTITLQTSTYKFENKANTSYPYLGYYSSTTNSNNGTYVWSAGRSSKTDIYLFKASSTPNFGTTYTYTTNPTCKFVVTVASPDNVTITATPSGGSAVAEGGNSGATVTAGTTVTLSGTPDACYETVLWTVTRDDGGANVLTNSSSTSFTMPESDVTVTASVSAKTNYTITYTIPSGGGSAVSPVTETCSGSTITLPNVTGISSEYSCETFLGWTTTAPNGSGTWASTPSYKAAGATSDAITENTTFYAVYSRSGGGASGSADLTNSDIVAKLYTTDGGRAYDDPEETITAADESVWTVKCYAPNSSTCFIQLKDGTGYYVKTPTMAGNITSITVNYTAVSSDSRTVYFNTSASKTSAVTHTFDGTYTSGNHDLEVDVSSLASSSIYILANNTFKIQSISLSYGPPPVISHTLYCGCEIDEFDLTYDANTANYAGSTTSCEGVTGWNFEDDGNYTICSTEPTLTGYKFTGWATNANGSGTVYEAGQEISCVPETPLTLYARYERVYTVAFNDQGTITNRTQASEGASVKVPAHTTPCTDEENEPDEYTWTFAGWSTTASLSGSLTPGLVLNATTGAENADYTPTADITLYAVYQKTTATSDAFQVGKSGAYKVGAFQGPAYDECYATTWTGTDNDGYFHCSTTVGDGGVFYFNYNAVTGKYTIQNSSGKYLGWKSAGGTSMTLSDSPSYFTVSSNSTGWSFLFDAAAAAGTNRYFTHETGYSASNYKAYTENNAIYLHAQPSVTYFTTMACASEFDMTFSMSSGSIVWGALSSADFLNKADGTVISTFPTATLDGWTFIGWTAGSQYNDIYDVTGYYSEQNSSNVDPISDPAVGGAIYGGSYGGSSYTMHSDIVMYPVFTKLEDNVPFDDINGGDYYIYYLSDITPAYGYSQEDRYAGTHRVYATGFTGSVSCSGNNYQFGGTLNCSSATVFTFTKLANGNWTIYDKSKKGYVVGQSDNGLQECTSDATGWSLVQNGSKWIMTYTSGRAIIANDYAHGATSAEFQNFYTNTVTNTPSQYHYVYLGSCTERIFSSNPTNTPNVEIHGTVKVTATNGQMVKATSVLSVTGNNLTTSTVTVASSSADFKLSTSANSGTFAQSITIPVVSNQVAPTAVYVAYSPSETTDGINNTVTVSVKDDPSDPAAEASTSVGDIQGRHLPENFVIVAKTGNIWVALPSDLTGVVPQEYSIVTVDNVSDPTKATYAKATDIWNLNKVHDTNGASQDRWGSYGTNALFVSDVDSKCLYATTAASPTTGIGTYATAASYYSSNPLFYEWSLTSSDLETYTLVNQNTTQTNKTLTYNPSTLKWGMYASGGSNIQEVRLLPVDNILTDMKWDVMEWDGKRPAFSGATSASGSIYYKITDADGTVPSGSATSKSYTRISGDIVKPSSDMAIAANAGRILMLFDASSSPTKMTSIEIPHIVTSTETSSGMGTAYDGMDVVVRSGGQITANNKARSFKTLTVYPGGKVNIPDNTTITVKQLMIRGGYSFLDNSFAFPEIYLTGTGDMTGSTNAIYDYFIDNNHFYLLTLPYDVNLTKVTDEIGYDNFSSWIQYYDGATRASGDQVSGWIDYDGTNDSYFGNAGTSGTLTDDKFEKGRGYLLAARPRRGKSVYNYTMVRDRAYAVVRFPLGNAEKISNSTYGELSTKSINVTAHGFTAGTLNSGVKANNAGWNFVGNPFMSSFGGAAAEDDLGGTSTITVGYLAKTPNEDGTDWNGNYEWKESSTRYVTMLNPITGAYSQSTITGASIAPFNAFFIQTKATGTLTFAAAGRKPLSLPALRAQEANSEIALEILLSDSASTDNTGLLIGNAFSEDYEFGDDLTKVASENQLAIYTQTGGYDLAFNAIPESVAAQPIPVGFTAPDSNAYVISLKEMASLNLLESVILKDYEKGGFETDLLVSDYEFNTHAVKQNNTRFTITVKVKHNSGTLTDIDTVGADGFDQIGIAVGNGTITLHGVPADAMVFVYDMTGKLLHNKISTDERMQLSVPQGVYNIRVQTPTGGRTLRTVVR